MTHLQSIPENPPFTTSRRLQMCYQKHWRPGDMYKLSLIIKHSSTMLVKGETCHEWMTSNIRCECKQKPEDWWQEQYAMMRILVELENHDWPFPFERYCWLDQTLSDKIAQMLEWSRSQNLHEYHPETNSMCDHGKWDGVWRQTSQQ